MGQSLHTALAEEGSLSMMAVLQLAHRIVSVLVCVCACRDVCSPLRQCAGPSWQVDVLHYIHSNEYVHADLNAENIYITPGPQSQVGGAL